MSENRKRLLLSLAISGFLPLVVTGCLGPTPEAIQAEVDASRTAAFREWSATREKGSQTEPVLKGGLSIDDAVKVALQYNKSLQASLQDKEIARGAVIASYQVALPTVTLSGQAVRIQNTANPTALNNYSASLTITQPLMQGVAIPAALRSARLFSSLADESVRAVVQQIIYATAQSYFNVLLAERLLETNEEAVRSA